MVIFVNRQIELVMKTLVSLLCCTALTVGSASAQSYRVARAGAFEENGRVEVGIPTSPLAVDLTVEKEVVTVGPYARYAQKFLGVRGALSDKTLYSVKAARVALLDRDATTASMSYIGICWRSIKRSVPNLKTLSTATSATFFSKLSSPVGYSVKGDVFWSFGKQNFSPTC